MLLNWFTVCAQIVNFLVLVWLLKRFLYGRIVRAIDARENKIASRLSEAQAKKEQAEQERVQYQNKLMELEQAQHSLLAQARLEVERQRTELIEKARKHVQLMESAWRADLGREREAFLTELRRKTAAAVVGIARRAVSDLASMELEDCTVKNFTSKLKMFDPGTLARFCNRPITIRTAFEVPETSRMALRQALSERMGDSSEVRFEAMPDMVWGIELRGDGYCVGWNWAVYLDELAQEIGSALETSSDQTHAGVI